VTVILVVLLAALIRIHLLDAPIERDEGEYAYAGQLILKGIPPYAEVYNMKMPGIYGAYALIMAVFGQTHGGIHLGLLLINAATTVFLFLLVMRLYGPFTGAMAAACFAVLCLGQAVLGIFANAEHFVILPAVGGILLLVRAVDSGRKVHIFLSGLLLGVAFIMKQHGAAFIAFGGLYLFLSLFTRRLSLSECVSKFLLFSAGAVVPFGLTCLILLWAGVFERFWFWTFLYASKYVSSVPLSTGLGILKKQITPIVDSSVLIWVLIPCGLSGFLLPAPLLHPPPSCDSPFGGHRDEFGGEAPFGFHGRKKGGAGLARRHSLVPFSLCKPALPLPGKPIYGNTHGLRLKALPGIHRGGKIHRGTLLRG
jgi:hypothetical protein